MKFFVDLSKKALIKSAASNVALERIVLKRRDSLAVEVVFVTRNAVATMPAGTTVSVALKKSFADSNFLASASGTPPILNLNTVPLEALFSATNPSAITALLEIRWTVPGETTRTATLQAEIQNSVILGTEATPEAIPDGKATQQEATAGTSNEKWMTPLRTAQAIAVLAPPPTWDAVLNKPATFPPSSHTHTASQITDFAAAVQAVSPAEHTHEISEVTGLTDALDSKATATALAAETTARAAADTALGAKIVTSIENQLLVTSGVANANGLYVVGANINGAPAWYKSGTSPVFQISLSRTGPSQAYFYKWSITQGTVEHFSSQGTSDPSTLPSPLGLEFNGAYGGATVTGLADAIAGKQPSGSYATLDGGGKVSASQLPSYVDDVLEVADFAALPATGETGKIYITLDTRRAYRWTGSQYLEISPSEVTSVAGKTGAVTLTKSDVGLSNVDNTSDANKPVSSAQLTALNAKQNLRTTVSFTLQDGDNYFPVSRNTLFLLSGNFTTARINLPTYLPDGSAAWVGDRIRIVWVGAKANANSRINVVAFAGDGQYPSLAQLHDQGQAAEFVLDPIPRNASGQLTWRADVDPIRWVQPPATPASFVAPNGAVYSPSDVAFDGSHFYIYGKKPDGAPVWLRTPMTATW